MSTQPVSEPEKIWNGIFKNKVEKDDPLWKEYVEKAGPFDERMIDEWNRVIDVILIYVGILYYSPHYLLVVELSIGCVINLCPDFLGYPNIYTATKRPSHHHQRSSRCDLQAAGRSS